MDDTVLGTMLASEALEAEYNAKSNVSGIQGGSRVEESQGRQEMVEVKDKVRVKRKLSWTSGTCQTQKGGCTQLKTRQKTEVRKTVVNGEKQSGMV